MVQPPAQRTCWEGGRGEGQRLCAVELALELPIDALGKRCVVLAC